MDIICGIDEAGRGPLIGNVLAGAVILDLKKPIPGLKDSKKLSHQKRLELYQIIIDHSFFNSSKFSPSKFLNVIILL